jgi:hypothetical protein
VLAKGLILIGENQSQIASNEKVSETLKRLAQEILRDLPKPQQLTEVMT